MLCFLFWSSAHKDQEYGRPVRPVSWATPDVAITPHYIELNEERRRYLEALGDPVWSFIHDPFQNAAALNRRLGYWPEPIEVGEVQRLPDNFNDPVPF